MTTPKDPLVSGLLADAKLVASYGRYGVFKDSSLFAAIGDAEKLDDATASQPAVVNLQTVLNDCSATVPFSTLAALRSGWLPGDMSRRTAFATYLLVALSVTMMIVIGKLTYVYNRGVSINVELQEIDNNDFSARFGQSIRQVWATKKQLGSAIDQQGSTTTTDLTLLKDAYYNSVDNLHSLDQRFSSLLVRAQGFMTQEAPFPIWGMQWAYCKLSASTTKAGAPPDFSNPRQMAINQFCSQEVAPAEQQGGAESSRPLLKQSDFDCKIKNNGQDNTEVVSATDMTTKVDDVSVDFDEATRSLQCEGVITITPNSISTLTLQAKTLSEVLSPYALWILPALYGALGGIMFHMRMILNPLLPNPTLARLIHRIALGALAGMILAWFMAPGTKLGGEVTGIGFSLFTFAFLFGFSLDIFFTILDQFVTMSVAGIKKFGSSAVS
ncbi:hypothetical protein EN836_26430 [Mesorhizobium sp. M1C.F.Ca.ET.193.01.1.1]|uniref:hypothetical protein n=1 Tax=unclassified Mesorhizobium TaxID=325217 RepID=UPI000FD20753|nr:MULTISPECIES: hypothetical protein [unclassified Mesorhizobium]TGQ51077.1 hypothetical protein EN853_26425 [Mesorhizobium sp. M1C.F.Ca.ET.210.01.1.1]TGQ66508.1 hypothetical protein EN855_026435 [Mesorhizobium sp. M1C.F.Ca.ET.212.01.1.1]TGR00904.1 hypothetical protein EN847_26425 [Mesorhizobium sp. M1C.F.Ca.ET.204.01.1.1]TGR21179.1 hypothetical protein EN839_26425 [Mesorhizobium sp. M1C.F.Ca.ET.196.01.1.1]TGR44097.1 hypothetical protein EN838_26425 [Mesorhizobium sp. M1C.F.Ca.ET.195.01.1.1]